MGTVDIALLATKTWGMSSSWSTNVTISSGNTPASVLVIAYANYSDEFTTYNATCSINSQAASQLASLASSYCAARIWLSNLLPSGTIPVAVNSLRGIHETGIFVVGIYRTRGTRGNEIATNNPDNPYTVNPTIYEGQLWVEFLGQAVNATSDPTGSSGQTSLVLENRCRVQYKKDTGTGTISFTSSFPANSTSDVYFGVEFGGIGQQFRVASVVGL